MDNYRIVSPVPFITISVKETRGWERERGAHLICHYADMVCCRHSPANPAPPPGPPRWAGGGGGGGWQTTRDNDATVYVINKRWRRSQLGKRWRPPKIVSGTVQRPHFRYCSDRQIFSRIEAFDIIRRNRLFWIRRYLQPLYQTKDKITMNVNCCNHPYFFSLPIAKMLMYK